MKKERYAGVTSPLCLFCNFIQGKKAIRLTVVIIEEYHPYQRHKKFYPTFFLQG